MRWRLLFIFLLLAASTANGREWTVKDKKPVKGEFVKLDGESVVINARGGEQRLPLDKLSSVDQAMAWQLDGEAKRAAIVDDAGGIKAKRTWTSTSGHSLEATYAGMTGGSVTLMSGRQRYPVPFHELTLKDQQFVRHAMDKRLLGTWLPPDSEGKMPAARRFVVNGNVIAAVLAGIDHKGNMILHTGGKLSYQPMIGFAIEDEAHIREEFSSRGLSKLIPADSNAREWTDWKGGKFRGRVLPVTFRYNPIVTVYMALEGAAFEKNIMEFSAASQTYLRKMASEGGVNVSFWPPVLPDPAAPVHTFHLKRGDKSWEVEGRFVSADGWNIYLRTAKSNGEQIYLSAMNKEDRRYLNKYLRENGQSLLPVVAEHCPQLEFELGNDVFKFAAEPVSGAGDLLEVFLPDSPSAGVRSRPRRISWAALTPASRDAVREELSAIGVNDTLVDEGLGQPVETIEERDWTLMVNEEKVPTRGVLTYVSTNTGHVTILGGTGAALYDLSRADQKYVVNAALNLGFDRFKRPEPRRSEPGFAPHDFRPGVPGIHGGGSGMHGGESSMHGGESGMHGGESGMHDAPAGGGADFRTVYYCSRCDVELPGKVSSGYRCVCGAILVGEEEYQRSGGVRTLSREEPTSALSRPSAAEAAANSDKGGAVALKPSGAFGYGEFMVLFWAGVGIAVVTVFGLFVLGVTFVARLGMK